MTVTEDKKQQAISVTHGTLCAAIIQRYDPSAELVGVKITNYSTGKSTIEKLISALNWCADNGVRLINLSMGTADVRNFGKLKAAVDILTPKGIVIVAAFNNQNVFTCPASLPNVFGGEMRSTWCVA